MDSDELVQSLEEVRRKEGNGAPVETEPYFDKIEMKNRAVLVFRPRGVGKTTFLLNDLGSCSFRPTILSFY